MKHRSPKGVRVACETHGDSQRKVYNSWLRDEIGVCSLKPWVLGLNVGITTEGRHSGVCAKRA